MLTSPENLHEREKQMKNRDLYALEVARVVALARYQDEARIDRAARLYTSEVVDTGGRVNGYHCSTSTCQCPDRKHTGKPCKHSMALWIGRAIPKIMAAQWYATLADGEECLITEHQHLKERGQVLIQTDRDRVPVKVHHSMVVLCGHCDTAESAQ